MSLTLVEDAKEGLKPGMQQPSSNDPISPVEGPRDAAKSSAYRITAKSGTYRLGPVDPTKAR